VKTFEEAWEHYQEFAIPPLMTKEQFAEMYVAISPQHPEPVEEPEEKDAGGSYCETCKRPYAFTERLLAGLQDMETAKEYHDTTEEHLKNLHKSGLAPIFPHVRGGL
jgi:hypothetical protein